MGGKSFTSRFLVTTEKSEKSIQIIHIVVFLCFQKKTFSANERFLLLPRVMLFVLPKINSRRRRHPPQLAHVAHTSGSARVLGVLCCDLVVICKKKTVKKMHCATQSCVQFEGLGFLSFDCHRKMDFELF